MADFIIIVIVAAAIFGAVSYRRKVKKNGGCGCGCAGCPDAPSCCSKKEE